MKEIIYKKAGIEDLPLLVKTRLDFLTEYWGAQTPEEVDRLSHHLQAYFSKSINDGTYTSYLAFCGDEVAGVGGLVVRTQPGGFKNPTGLVGYVMNMYTAPAHRRKGIAGRILELLMQEGQARGIVAFELHATAAGEPVYIQHGFKLHGEPTYRKMITEG